jgi:ABC-type transport system involved in cytochrome bd biosynthesis fused ATPase/permease subunit
MNDVISFIIKLAGQILQAISLLQQSPKLTDDEIREELERISAQEKADDEAEWAIVKKGKEQ